MLGDEGTTIIRSFVNRSSDDRVSLKDVNH